MTKIPLPNFTQLPNVFFDHWMAILSGGEFKVLCIIARKTFGFHKTRDKISSSQISKLTGLTKEGIRNITKSLWLHGLIDIHKGTTKSGDPDINTYEIRVDDSEAPPWMKEKTEEKKKDSKKVRPPTQLGGVPNSVAPQKKLLQKKESLSEERQAKPQRKPKTLSLDEQELFDNMTKDEGLPWIDPGGLKRLILSTSKAAVREGLHRLMSSNKRLRQCKESKIQCPMAVLISKAREIHDARVDKKE